MSRPPWFVLVLVLVLVLGLPTPVHAADQKEKEALFLLGCFTVFPLATFLSGLAFHLFLRAIAPRRTRRLVHAVEGAFVRTLVFGVLDTALLFAVFAGTAEKAKPIAVFVFILWMALAFFGLHGIARELGGRVLGPSEGPRPEVRELAAGWFVLSYVAWFPVIGWIYAGLCAVRGLGAAVLHAFMTDAD